MPLKPILLVSGGTGFVGTLLYGYLKRHFRLTVISRDSQKNKTDCSFISYDQFFSVPPPHDHFLHLAVLNNDLKYSASEYEAINNQFSKKIFYQSSINRRGLFINLSSFHAMHNSKNGYGMSKRKFDNFLLSADMKNVIVLLCPIIYGKRFAGGLRFLEWLPPRLQAVCLTFLASLKPTLHVRRLAAAILLCTKYQNVNPRRLYLANPIHRKQMFCVIIRIIDLIGASIGLTITLCLLPLLSFLIKTTSKGPIFFVQTRVGHNQRLFKCFKFRTMSVKTPEVATHLIDRGSLTLVGGFMRRYKIDELPQFINVLRGDMSIVGPRPCLPSQSKLIEARKNRGVFDLKPGVTGLAQVDGYDMSDVEGLVEQDSLFKVQNSILLYFKLVLWTMLGRGNGDHAK